LPGMIWTNESPFDLIVCNPPYVSAAEYEALDKNVKDYEPRLALWAGDDGLDVYRRIVQRVDEFLKSGAPLMLEIGYAQGPAVRDLLDTTGLFGYAQGPAVRDLLDTTGLFAEIKIEKDQNNNDRIATARKRKEA